MIIAIGYSYSYQGKLTHTYTHIRSLLAVALVNNLLFVCCACNPALQRDKTPPREQIASPECSIALPPTHAFKV